MKTALTILALVIHGCYINAQCDDCYLAYDTSKSDTTWIKMGKQRKSKTYFNLQGGVAENTVTRNATLTYQVGFRRQFSDIGFKASFGQTDGLYHTFDSYTLAGTYRPLDGFYASVGYRHDNGRGWGSNRNGVVVGLNALLPITDGAKIMATVEPYFSDIIITNIMVGVQLDFILNKKGKPRFF